MNIPGAKLTIVAVLAMGSLVHAGLTYHAQADFDDIRVVTP